MLQHLSGRASMKRRGRGGGKGGEEEREGREKRGEKKKTQTLWRIEPTIFHIIAQLRL